MQREGHVSVCTVRRAALYCTGGGVNTWQAESSIVTLQREGDALQSRLQVRAVAEHHVSKSSR